MAANIKRETHEIDAKGKALGRVASEIVIFLRGKNKPEYEFNLDCGDIVHIKNVNMLVLSGKKEEQKKYFRFSGYPSGITPTLLKKLKDEHPDKLLFRTVNNMMPKNRLRNVQMKRLIID